MPDLKPEILFEDNHLLVLSKPAGLLSQGEHKGDPNLVDWLRGYLGRPYVGLVHRLDRNTSGLMVVAKRTKSAQRLTESLQTGKLCRSYLAWVEGELPETVKWKHALLKTEKTNTVRVVPETTPKAQVAILSGKRVRTAHFGNSILTLAEFTLETGRSHQIRAQSSHEGFPLLGDAKYGSRVRFARTALHSYRISFPHPMSSEIMDFKTELPEDMRI